MAFVVVQHLDPKHESLLPEILGKKTTMAVSPATAGEAVQPDHVYVIPPDALLTVHGGFLELKRRTSAPERPFPVDLLFASLAAEYGDRAVGIVLSGADADGSLGLREIKHAGGFTFAQQPESARFPTMPQHAIETGCVDLVLRPSEIADELTRLSRRLQTPEPHPRSKSESTPDVAQGDGRCRPGPCLPTASLGARRGLHPLQADHDQAPPRAAHDAATDREPRRVPRITRSRSWRARRAVPGLPDPRDRVLSGSDAPSKHCVRMCFPHSVKAGLQRTPSVSGCPVARLARRCIPSPSCFSNTSVTASRQSRIQIFGTDVSEAALEKARAGRVLRQCAARGVG